MIRALLLIVAAAALVGCTRMRFVVDTVPAEDKLTETEVRSDPAASGSSKVALIAVSGLIVDARSRYPWSANENPVARFSEAMEKAATDEKVKAVILRIDSPGGTVTASDVMYETVMQFKTRTGKPVVVQMGSVAASGGYYLACSGDEIIAHPTTITGSIGVIIQTINFSEGMGRIGIRADAITSGPSKDMGSPFRPMTPEHRAMFQGIVDEFYESFVTVVTERRPVSSEHIEEVTDGRIVTGRRAEEVGLVDATGGLDESFEAAKRLAGVEAARLVKYHRPIEFVNSPYSASTAPSVSSQVNLMQLNVDAGMTRRDPGFWYLWDPSLF